MKKQGQFILLTRLEFYEWLKKQTFNRKISIIQNHHTWAPNYTSFNGSNHFARLEAMKRFHVHTNGWSDIGQNVTTFPDGLIAICRSFDTTPAGIKGANTAALCLEHLGNFDVNGDHMTEEHLHTITFINAALCEIFKLPVDTEHIVYHHWYSSTGTKVYNFKSGVQLNGLPTKSCPGSNFFQGNSVLQAHKSFIPLVREAYNNFTAKDDESMTPSERQQFEQLKQLVATLKSEIKALTNSKNVLKKGAQEQGTSIKKTSERVKLLENRDKLNQIPSYAQKAVSALVQLRDQNGSPVIDTPQGRSADFYSLITVLYRAGLLDKK
ncbi:peptidoglycan recognition protein family protein [Paenibacillus glucanolyticus]|uniref:peptidoglycan recognition protein family protein n=1 Tax=Paenibacillus sp. LBL TaxID=2940563 RepID=UPI002474547E|nr:N-acetylmuramoyl-L-alanine amidase [Paenibacillus sp. LBL]